MTCQAIAPLCAREGTSTTWEIEMFGLVAGDTVPLDPAGLTTLTATLTSLDTGEAIFTDRDVLGALDDGVLALALTPADLTMVTARAIESRVLTLSATYGSGQAWHVDIPVQVRGLVGVE
jgi:hypothetical protein